MAKSPFSATSYAPMTVTSTLPASDQRKGVGVMHDGHSRPGGHVLAAGVDQVSILLSLLGQRTEADDAVSPNER